MSQYVTLLNRLSLSLQIISDGHAD